MSWRSRLWWAAALALSVAGAAYVAAGPAGGFAFFGYGGFCPGREFYLFELSRVWSVAFAVPLLGYAGAPLLVLGFAACWLGTRRGRPGLGRVLARVMATVVLVVYGTGPLAFAVDLAIDRACTGAWGGLAGLWFFLGPALAPVLAALCAFTAVRLPRHRLRRLVSGRRFRRGAAVVLGVALLGLAPAADLASGPIRPLVCEPAYPYAKTVPTGENAFLCGARQGAQYPTLPDHRLLAFGREQCARYPGTTVHAAFLAPICPPAAADWQREIDAEEAEYAREEAESQAECDRFRHKPLIKPVRVARILEFSEIGLEAYEDHEDSEDDPVMHHDLVGSATGVLRIDLAADYEQCVTTETYRRRPPVEVKGWDKVIEVGYLSPTGDFTLRDPFDSPELPNLAVAGRGHYRVRVHYREPDWEAWTPQHLLVMVYPGRGDEVIDLKRTRRPAGGR
ncbi:hypothetical protein [Nonomuraea rubra]|uniref:Uncharacterized protein n=1 Tax=Nonomuraea rubra TaxID=46180 RepID=A0A7X0P0G5_9ACTN|nr:hypothetical protein [Nonomuraea rubra]MBB6552726.1 hypothetical protein [Nonomuraea rubra]